MLCVRGRWEACAVPVPDEQCEYPWIRSGGGIFYDIQGAYGYNGIISSSGDDIFIRRFHESFDQWCLENGIIAEFTRFHPLLDNQRLASPKMTTLFSRHTVKLNLQLSIDEIWTQQISSKNRNLIRRAEKDGVEIIESDDYEQFRRLYDQTMENVGAEDFYFFPKVYYDNFQKELSEDSSLCFAVCGGKAIAGSLFMYSHDYAHYHLSGRDKEYSRIPAGNLLLWYGIQKAKARDCKWFHFGGGTTSDDNDSLLHFKQNFSKEQGEFWIGKRIHNQEIYKEVVRQWQEKYPASYAQNSKKLLGYRDIK